MTTRISPSRAHGGLRGGLSTGVLHLIEAAIQAHLDAAEALILMLDELDGDEDLEDDGSAEPSLG